MLLSFSQPHDAPANVVAEAEIAFEEGTPLAGLKLCGITIRRDSDQKLFVTLPAKSFGTGNERRYFDWLRSVQPMSSQEGRDARDRFRSWVLQEFDAHRERGLTAS